MKYIYGLIFLLLLMFDQNRAFYCLEEGQCITVWKRIGGQCYVIPGEYYGLTKPSDNYILTNNDQYLTVYTTIELPNHFIVRNQKTDKKEKVVSYERVCNSDSLCMFLDYSAKVHRTNLYDNEATRFNQVKNGVNYFDINIKENYAVDKSGDEL